MFIFHPHRKTIKMCAPVDACSRNMILCHICLLSIAKPIHDVPNQNKSNLKIWKILFFHHIYKLFGAKMGQKCKFSIWLRMTSIGSILFLQIWVGQR